MSSFTASSAVNKSTKKFTPKAPPQNRPRQVGAGATEQNSSRSTPAAEAARASSQTPSTLPSTQKLLPEILQPSTKDAPHQANAQGPSRNAEESLPQPTSTTIPPPPTVVIEKPTSSQRRRDQVDGAEAAKPKAATRPAKEVPPTISTPRTRSQTSGTEFAIPTEPASKRRRTQASQPAESSGSVATASSSTPIPTIEVDLSDSEPANKRRRTTSKSKSTPKTSATAADTPVATSKRRRNSSTPGTRRPRAKSPENAEEVTIDPSISKMADLCKDLKTGKKSTRFEELRQLDFTEGARRQKEQENREQTREASQAPAPEKDAPAVGNSIQMRIVNGVLVTDETSLQIDRHAREADAHATMEVVEESSLTRRVNSATYSKRERADKWTPDLTERFYEGLRMFGTDFEMVSKLFEGRSRGMIKQKFCLEEKRNPGLINDALRTRVPVDLVEFEKISARTFQDPQVFEAELAKEAEEHRKASEAAAVETT